MITIVLYNCEVKLMKKWWMIRAGDNNELIPIWKEKVIASIGWPRLGDPKQYKQKKK